MNALRPTSPPPADVSKGEPCTGEPARQSVAQVVTVIFTEGARTLIEIFSQPIESVDFYAETAQ